MDVAVQVPVNTETEYVPDVVTVIDCVVSPFDQRYPEAEPADSVTDPPSQKVVGPPAVTVAPGGADTVVVAAAVQPLLSVTVTL
jgi:hypothetical protein